MENTTVVTFKGWKCRLRFARYVENDRTAVQLIDAVDTEPVATATINLPVDLADDEIIVKDYSENEGMLHALEQAGIVEDTGKRIPLPYVDVPICRLLVTPTYNDISQEVM